MIIMALDHVRDYFHGDAFFYSPTDLSLTSPALFFTRFITHYCAPVFVFLSGASAYLSGTKKSKRDLSRYLLTRGLWLVLAEIFIITFFKTFNPAYHFVSLQVIWAIGISMMAMAGLIYLKWQYLLVTGIVLVFAHNLLDHIQVGGDGIAAFLWAVLHQQQLFQFGYISVLVNYPVLPWIGIMALGYCCGNIYSARYNEARRRKILMWLGLGAVLLFIVLRSGNWYGDPANWEGQKNMLYTVLSFLNVTKYPPSLLYILITLGPALIFLSVSEKPVKAWGERILVFGRTPMFYYLAHLLFIHLFASIAALLTGYPDMLILNISVYKTEALKGFGFNLLVVYLIWILLVMLLYPLCRWYDQYKRANQQVSTWLSYL